MKKIVIFIVMVVIGLTISINVKGNEHVTVSDEIYYMNLEKTILSVVNTSLEKEGFYSCGITLNSIRKVNEDKEYTIKIHHYKISELSKEEKEELTKYLEKETYAYANCSVNYNFVE